MSLRLAFISLLSLVLHDATFAADDWPQFRGPTGQGTSAAVDVPLNWDARTHVAWQTALPGEGWSSPVLHQGRLYLSAAVPVEGSEPGDYTLRVLSLEAATGKSLGDVEVFRQDGESDARIHSKNSHASPTPIVHDDLIYVHFGHQGTACLDLRGKVVWRNNRIKYSPVHGAGGSPVVAGDLLIFSCDGARQQLVVALDRYSGEARWRQERNTEHGKKFSFSTPVLIEAGGQQQIVSPGSGAVCAYEAASGKELWRVRYDGYSVIPRPVFGQGLVFISTGYDRPEVLAIRPDGSGDVTDTHVAWRLSKGAPHTPSLLLVGDELYMVSDRGIATCVDAATGRVHWQERIGGNFSASPVYADGRIYLQSEEGVGTVLAAGKTFEKLAANPLGERTLASYAVTDGAIFIRSAKHLYRIEE